MHHNLHQFNSNGYLVLNNFMSAAECDAVMQRAEELASAYDYGGHPSPWNVFFSTCHLNYGFSDSLKKLILFPIFVIINKKKK